MTADGTLEKICSLLEADEIAIRGYGIFLLAQLAGIRLILVDTPAQRACWYYAMHGISNGSLYGIVERLESGQDTPVRFLRGGKVARLPTWLAEILEQDTITQIEWSELLNRLPSLLNGELYWPELGKLSPFVQTLTFGEARQNEELLKLCTTSEDPLIRSIAFSALGMNVGDVGADMVERGLNDYDARVRSAAISLLGKSTDSRAIQFLEASLDDKAPAVRLTAAMTLAKMRTPESFRVLERLLKNKNQSHRLDAATALSYTRDDTALDLLVGAAQHETMGELLELFRDLLVRMALPGFTADIAWARKVVTVCEARGLSDVAARIRTRTRGI